MQVQSSWARTTGLIRTRLACITKIGLRTVPTNTEVFLYSYDYAGKTDWG